MLYNSRRTNKKGKLMPRMQLLIDNIDTELLRDQRDTLLGVIDEFSGLSEPDTIEALDGIVSLLDQMLDIAETQDGRLVWRRQEPEEYSSTIGRQIREAVHRHKWMTAEDIRKEKEEESQEINRGSGDVDPFENIGLNEQ